MGRLKAFAISFALLVPVLFLAIIVIVFAGLTGGITLGHVQRMVVGSGSEDEDDSEDDHEWGEVPIDGPREEGGVCVNCGRYASEAAEPCEEQPRN